MNVLIPYYGPDMAAQRSGISLTTTGCSNPGDDRPGFKVTWANRWDLLDELVAAGRLRRIHLGPNTYGAVEYFYV